jgi:anthranilate synthase component 2
MGRNGRLLIIDNFDSFTWNLVRMIEEEGAPVCEVVREDALDPGRCEDFDKIMISPGPGLPSDFPRMMEVIRRYSPTHTILGVCLGHQAIAEVFGGRLIRLEEVHHGITAEMQVRDEADSLFSMLPSTFSVGLYHSWTVDPASFPSALRITGNSADRNILALRHETYAARGVQFHPESIMTPWGRQLLRNWLDLC